MTAFALVDGIAIGHLVFVAIFLVFFLGIPATIIHIEKLKDRKLLAQYYKEEEIRRQRLDEIARLFEPPAPIAKKEAPSVTRTPITVEPARRRFLPLNPTHGSIS